MQENFSCVDGSKVCLRLRDRRKGINTATEAEQIEIK